MKIVCSAEMPYAREAFSTLGEALLIPGREITAQDVRDADLIAIRSTTRVDRGLLEGSTVRFVGTATIGTDHLDKDYLEAAGVRWCYAPGCNANSVSEYITSALLCLARRHGFALRGRTIGVVGVGNVGQRVAAKAHALGMTVLLNDPPRQRAEGNTCRGVGAAGIPFSPLEQVLAQADIVTLHVPLTREGPDATQHLAGRAFFEHMQPGSILFNAARGAVVRTDDLLAAMDRGIPARVVLDTWEGEPAYRRDLLPRVDLGTPHIAGHSFEGKVAGTVMVYREACRFLGQAATWTPDALLPEPAVPEIVAEASGRDTEDVLWDVVRRVYDVRADDNALRASLRDGSDHAGAFERLRKTYPVRREFRFTRVTLGSASPQLRHTVGRLGFALRNDSCGRCMAACTTGRL